MNLPGLNKFWPPALVILAVFFLALGLYLGMNGGVAKARAQVSFENAKQVKQAMANFYSDNNRYPTATEFANTSIMAQYLRNFPVILPASALCSQNLVYKQLTPTSYQLSFCLDTSINGYQKGWNNVQF